MSESAKHIVEGRRVLLGMESVTTDKPDASRASDDEHLGSSSTANGFSIIIHSYLSKQSYPTCLCDSLSVGSLLDSLS